MALMPLPAAVSHVDSSYASTLKALQLIHLGTLVLLLKSGLQSTPLEVQNIASWLDHRISRIHSLCLVTCKSDTTLAALINSIMDSLSIDLLLLKYASG